MAAASGISLTMRLLRGIPNRAANAVLLDALHAPDLTMRLAALQALVERSEPQGRAALLEIIHDAPVDVRSAARKPEILKRMRKTVLQALRSDDISRTKIACRFAVDTEMLAALPVLAELASVSDHPYGIGLATATLQLSRAMANGIESGVYVEGIDPSFYRTAAVRQLTAAAEKFGEHRRLELVEALLLITTRDNNAVLNMLRTEGHPCQQALADTLAVSPSHGAMDVLCHAIVDSDSSSKLLQIASHRSDRTFLTRLAEQVGYPIGVRPRENTRRVANFAWMTSEERDLVLTVAGKHQAALVSLAAVTGAPMRERLRFVRFVLEHGEVAGRTAACHLLRDFDSPDVATALRGALDDCAGPVVAAAIRQLRVRKISGVEKLLIDFLEHPAPEVQRAARDELHELSLVSYREMFELLSEPARRSAGRLIALADPTAAEQLAADLNHPTPRQRMEGLAMIDAMGLADELCGPLTTALGDNDAGVRAEAARLLGTTTQERGTVHAALAEVVEDPNRLVRSMAEKSLDALSSLDAAADLIDELRQEFPNDAEEERS